MASTTTSRGMMVEASASRKLRRMLVLMFCRSSTCSATPWPMTVCGSGSGQKTANLARAAGSSTMISSPSPIVQIWRSSGTPSPSLSMRMNHSPNWISGSPCAASRAPPKIMPSPPGLRRSCSSVEKPGPRAEIVVQRPGREAHLHELRQRHHAAPGRRAPRSGRGAPRARSGTRPAAPPRRDASASAWCAAP